MAIADQTNHSRLKRRLLISLRYESMYGCGVAWAAGVRARLRWRGLFISVLLDSSHASSSASSAPSGSFRLRSVGAAPPGHWSQYRLEAGTVDRGVAVYVAHDTQPKPVVILISGFGLRSTHDAGPGWFIS